MIRLRCLGNAIEIRLNGHQSHAAVLRGCGLSSCALIGIDDVLQRHAFLSVLLKFGIRRWDDPITQFRLFPPRFARLLFPDEFGNLGSKGLDITEGRLENVARRAGAP